MFSGDRRAILCLAMIVFESPRVSSDPVQVQDDNSAVLIVSFDSFRHDFIKRSITPTLLKLRQRGSFAEHMKCSFPSKTFPNHQTIATGLHPEVHGVLANSVFDDKFENELTYDNEQLYHYNQQVEPIWIRYERVMDGRRSGAMMWPGAQHKFQEKLPTFSIPLNRSKSFNDRVDETLSWFKHAETPINMGLLYFEEPDTQIHLHGPNSKEANAQIRKVDVTMKYLLERMEQLNLTDRLNVILLSDHGSHESRYEKLLDLGKYVDMNALTWAGASPILQIQPHKGKEDEVFQNLTRAEKQTNHFKVYRKKDMPDKWHYRNNSRVADLLVLATVGFAFQGRIKNIDEDWKTLYFNATLKPGNVFGVHGYSNDEPTMQPHFLAWGPKIKSNFKIKPFNNTDVYPLVAHILSMPLPTDPLAINGTIDSLAPILKHYATNKTTLHKA